MSFEKEHPGDKQRETKQRCTAPHPVVPFLFFLGTLALALLVFYLLRRIL